MNITVDIKINAPRLTVWKAVTDIDRWEQMISGIISIDILERPADALVGLKWKETREMFGKEATETMWVTGAAENEFYSTRAESHGAVYTTRISLQDSGSGTMLAMSFGAVAQTRVARVMSFLMAPVIRKSMIKALEKDLEDIKAFVEQG